MKLLSVCGKVGCYAQQVPISTAVTGRSETFQPGIRANICNTGEGRTLILEY